MERTEAIVVGAGITGLAASVALEKSGVSVRLLEANSELGGSLATQEVGGYRFELGPNTVLEKPPVKRLLEISELGEMVVPAAPAGKKRFIYKGDRIHAMPSGPFSFLRSPLFRLGDLTKLAREPWVARSEAEDESIADFVRRRLGQGFLDYAVGPFVSGVYAGDPERLSVRWAVPRIKALETDYGSLIRGALAKRKGPEPAGRMISFEGGCAELARRLADTVSAVETDVRVERVDQTDRGLAVTTSDGRILESSRGVLAVPSDVTARLLEAATDGESSAFDTIPHAPVVVVGLGFPRAQVAHPLDGFGFLSPRCENLQLLGCLFISSIFPDRAPEGHVALTNFIGGRTNPGILDRTDDEIRELVLDELRPTLGLTGEPDVTVVRRWSRAIPQYELGHERFVELAAEIEGRIPGLAVAGNFVGGVSVPDCIQRGLDAAERLAAR